MGLTGPRHWFLLLTTSGGGITPQICCIYLLTPIDHHFPPLDRKHSHPFLTTCDSLRSDYKLTSPRPRLTARIHHGRNIQKSRTVAIVPLQTHLGTTTYQIFTDEVKISVLLRKHDATIRRRASMIPHIGRAWVAGSLALGSIKQTGE